MADENKPDASVTETEAKSLQGSTGPNRIPAFGKTRGLDENTQLTEKADLESIKEGSAENSGNPNSDPAATRAEALAKSAQKEDDSDFVQYTSHPVSAFRIGRFQFRNGVLRLPPEEAKELDKLLEGATLRTQQVVRKVDVAAGEKVARDFLQLNGGTRKRDVDTSDNAPPAPRPDESKA